MTDSDQTVKSAIGILKQWRDNASGLPWSMGDEAPWDYNEVNVACEEGEGDVTDYISIHDAQLIVGVSGNLGLLRGLIELLEAELAESGVCHCGGDVANHTGWDNHSPVDTGVPENPLVRAIAEAIVYAEKSI